jgi:RNA recognition motif-containing protein
LIIYVGNLPTSWNDDDIIQYFSQYGKIIDAKLIKKMGAFNGSALVKFYSLTDAENAIEKLKDVTLTGSDRKVNIKWLDTEEQRLGIGEKD